MNFLLSTEAWQVFSKRKNIYIYHNDEVKGGVNLDKNKEDRANSPGLSQWSIKRRVV